MQISIHALLGGAHHARGLTVVIDVFRAFSTACYAINAGAARIIPVAELEQAYALKREHPDWLLMGERDGIKQPGFDFGNSPTEVEAVDLSGRTVVHTTSAGTQGLVAAMSAPEVSEVLTGSFVNLGATVEYIRSREPEAVTFVAMGTAGRERSGEDDLCAMYMKNELQGVPNRFEVIKGYLATIESARKFFDSKADYAPERDFELCTALDRFDFALTARRDEDGLLTLRAAKPAPA
ncbi:2-phosphosulfolactate phosphatase [Desulfocurvibacter africanus]|uniref:2-phosphosulfolactate phosphatase n=1 Tax=Desulfocurvibacter africanus TaxID=873 RepID=UPI00041333C1|nr:2-phosphosulfolactate phosphatase [Desulfocurvibacter africanus]